MLERIEDESLWLRSPALADVFVGREAFQRLEPTSEVVGCDEVGEMLSELLVALVVEALDSGSLMVRFILSTWPLVQGCFGLVSRWSMSFSGAGEFESMSAEERASCDGLFDLADSQATTAGYREVDAVVGENRMDLVRHGRDEMAKEVGGDPGGRFLMSSTKANFDVRSMATKR